MNLPQVLQHHSSEGRQQIDDGLHNGYRESTMYHMYHRFELDSMLWDHMYVYVHTKSHMHMYTHKKRIILNIVPRYVFENSHERYC